MSLLRFRLVRVGALTIATAACAFGGYSLAPLYGQTSDDVHVAESLSTLLQAARTVVSRHQAEINNPDVGDKGFTGAKVLAEAVSAYKNATGVDPSAIDPSTRQGRLLRAQMDSIVEVVDANQQTINKKGLGFKAFIPATFGRLVNEAFSRRAGQEAEVKVTAPSDRIRNLKARADPWELKVITEKFLLTSWPKGKDFSADGRKQGPAGIPHGRSGILRSLLSFVSRRSEGRHRRDRLSERRRKRGRPRRSHQHQPLSLSVRDDNDASAAKYQDPGTGR